MSDENKQLNKVENGSNGLNSLSLSDLEVFKDNPHLIYLYKKTEKMVSALYLLSSFISDREPVKWQIREASVNLLSLSVNLSDRTSTKQITERFDFVSTGLKLLSFLEISYISGIISEMNFNILKHELCSLIQIIEKEGKGEGAKGLIFPEHFFEVARPSDKEEVGNYEKNFSPMAGISSKGHNTMSDRMSFKNNEIKQKDKTDRRGIIINLLKKDSGLGIKDFTSAIKGCSEKTIQRELATLVSKGQIKKEGEKRWSRYSLK